MNISSTIHTFPTISDDVYIDIIPLMSNQGSIETFPIISNQGTIMSTPSLNHTGEVLLIVGVCVLVVVAIALAPETGGTSLLLLGA